MRWQKAVTPLAALTLAVIALLASPRELAAQRTQVIGYSHVIDRNAVSIDQNSGTGRAGYAMLRFSTSKDWWTAVYLVDKNGKKHGIQKVDGRYSPASRTIEVPLSLLGRWVPLEFWTAKAFGVHTHMTTLNVYPKELDGKVTNVHWSRGATPDRPAGLGISQAEMIDGNPVTIVSSGESRAGYAKLRFSTSKDWWTAVYLVDKKGKKHGIQKVNGRYSPASRTVEVPLILLGAEVPLEFWTAKTLGVRTHMTTLKLPAEELDGRVTDVNWPDSESPSQVRTLRADGNDVQIDWTHHGTDGRVRLRFSTTKDWWTAVYLVDKNGKKHGIQKVDGKYSPASGEISLPLTDFTTEVTIEFWTAKAFGVHTYMTRAKYPINQVRDRIVAINWPK